MQRWVSCNVQPGFLLKSAPLPDVLLLSLYVHGASTFINIPNMCACLYNTAELHYSNYLNRVINLHHCGHVSLPCVPSSGSAVLCCVATAPLPPSHPLVSHTWSASPTPAVIPMRSAAFEEHLLTSALTSSSLHLLRDDWHSPGFWEMASLSFPNVSAERLLCSTPDSRSARWVDCR